MKTRGLTSVGILATAGQALDYAGAFNGELTYYGGGMDPQQGNCAMKSGFPAAYDGLLRVAINSPQYDDSKACGACIEIDSFGECGSYLRGQKVGVVMDRCPECKQGDVDVLAEDGDGRCEVSWRFVECPVPENRCEYRFEGSNANYCKVQCRGTAAPVASMSVNGVEGVLEDNDYHFVMRDGAGSFEGVVEVRTTLVDGETMVDQVEMVAEGIGAVRGTSKGGRTAQPTERKVQEVQVPPETMEEPEVTESAASVEPVRQQQPPIEDPTQDGEPYSATTVPPPDAARPSPSPARLTKPPPALAGNYVAPPRRRNRKGACHRR